MKLLIVDSRSIKDFDLSGYIPENTDLIISGGAEGVDSIAENYADAHRISKLIIRPDYTRYKRGAPIIRNQKMVDIADSVLVIWDGTSRGSFSTIKYAQKTNKHLIIINTSQEKGH